MTADIVNLNRARKAKARADKEATAAENRVRFGRTKAEKAAERQQTTLAERRLDGHRLDQATGRDDDADPTPHT